MTRIVISRGDGGVSTIDLAPGADVDRWINAWKAQYGPIYGYQSHQEVPVELLPSDHTFFDAWTFVDGSIQVDMPKAREVQKEWLRFLRKPLLEAADVEFIRAIEDGDASKQAEIVARKEALRKVTDDPAIDAAMTPEALKNVLPDILK